MVRISTLKRIFRINGAVVEDQNPSLPLKDAIRALTLNYPILRHTQVLEEDGILSTDGSTLEYTVVLPPAKTQG